MLQNSYQTRGFNTRSACHSYCPGKRLGCCNRENSTKQCAGPVHLTAEWDIGSRSCCIGAGKKFSAEGGLLNFCSVNGGREHQPRFPYLAPYPLSNNALLSVPKNNPPPGSPYWNKSKECNTCEGFKVIKNYSVPGVF